MPNDRSLGGQGTEPQAGKSYRRAGQRAKCSGELQHPWAERPAEANGSELFTHRATSIIINHHEVIVSINLYVPKQKSLKYRNPKLAKLF